MAEELRISDTSDKPEKYLQLLSQIASLIADETDLTANLANIAAALHQVFRWLWTGFYIVKGDELVLGPFQGPVACTRIAYGKGVCGMAWKQAKSILVPDVERFPGHIACSGLSVSEIVVPLYDNKSNIIGVLDVDSELFEVLDETDLHYLEKIAALITEKL